MIEPWLSDLALQLCRIDGVVGVLLGGSRARGEHTESSDWDLGLYYRGPLDTGALRGLARQIAGTDADVCEPGQWGPWVDGGAWLNVGGRPVDWIYRNVDRVLTALDDAEHGRFEFNAQTGHPLGVPDYAYVGELAVGVVLEDPSGELARAQHRTVTYPPALAAAVIDRLWEADFLIGGLVKSARRADAVWVAGCLFRVVMLCAHALHARAGKWLINEKGAVRSAGALEIGPPDFAGRAGALLGDLGTETRELVAAMDVATVLVADVRTAIS